MRVLEGGCLTDGGCRERGGRRGSPAARPPGPSARPPQHVPPRAGYRLLTEDVVPGDPGAASPDSVSEHAAVTAMHSDGASSEGGASEAGESVQAMDEWDRLSDESSSQDESMPASAQLHAAHSGEVAGHLAGLAISPADASRRGRAAGNAGGGSWWPAFDDTSSGPWQPSPQQQQQQQQEQPTAPAASIRLPPQQRAAIRAAMQQVQLRYEPPWASALPEENWRSLLAQRLGTSAQRPDPS